MSLDPSQLLRADWRAGDASALLRPWWGMSPGRLLLRALVQGAVAAVLMVVALRVRSGEYLPDDAALGEVGLGDSRSTIDTVALMLAALAALWLLFSLLRIVVAILDLLGRTAAEGTVVSITERRTWGFLPGIVQEMLWNRHDQGIDQRRSHIVLTIHTEAGQRSWKLTAGKARGVRPGDVVRVVATPINGYVRSVEQARAQQPG